MKVSQSGEQSVEYILTDFLITSYAVSIPALKDLGVRHVLSVIIEVHGTSTLHVFLSRRQNHLVVAVSVLLRV